MFEKRFCLWFQDPFTLFLTSDIFKKEMHLRILDFSLLNFVYIPVAESRREILEVFPPMLGQQGKRTLSHPANERTQGASLQLPNDSWCYLTLTVLLGTGDVRTPVRNCETCKFMDELTEV